MAIDNSGLVYLFDSIFQIENLAGRPVCPGHIEVFVAGTDTKYITYQNFDGTRNPFKVPLNSDGRAVILVEAQFKYDVYIYDSFNNMICSRLNVAPAVGGDVSVSGLTEVYHDESLSGDGTPYAPLAVVSAGKVYSGIEPIVVNNDEDKISAQTATFGVESPLYFVKDEASATVIGVDQSAMENFLTGKANTTALNEVRDNMMSATAIDGVDNIITGYNGSAFSAGSTYSGISPVVVDNENNTISVSSKELEAQAPLQITDVGSAYQLSITGAINSPRTRVIEYGTDRWDDVKSAMDDMSAGNIDYVVMKYTDASGNEYYAPLDKYAPDAACHFVCPSNEQDTVYGYGQRRKDTIFTINSGDQWVTRNVRPFIGRVIGGTNVTVDVQGEDYVISANGVDASASEAINLVTANSGDWNGVSSKLDTTAFSTVSGDFITALPESANWNSTYDTVYAKSGSWSSRPQEPVSGINIDIFESAGTVVFSGMTGGSTYTGDAQGALDEVYTNSANWDSTHNTVSDNSASWGQGGKTYTGISPVIVDNTADTISVSAKAIAVETPLTFNETSTAFVFGISGTDKWDSTYDTVHDNSASWTGGGGADYTAGAGIDITNDVISVTGKEDTITYGYSGNAISSLNGHAILGDPIPYEVYGISASANISAYESDSALWISGRDWTPELNDKLDSTAQVVTSTAGDGTYVTAINGMGISGQGGGGGAATLPVSGSAGNNSAVYGLYDMKIEYNLPSVGGSEPDHAYARIDNASVTVYESNDEDQSYNTIRILPSFIELYNPADGHAYIGAADVLSWQSTYNTVHDNSGNWTGGGGSTYTGDAQGALDEVYTNSGTWNTVTDKLDTTAQVVTAVGTASVTTIFPYSVSYLVSSINGSAILPYGYSVLSAASANWNSTYNTVHDNSASWTGGGGDFTGLFQAQYGTTTYSDIKNAVDNHKVVYCKSGGRMAFLAYSGSNNYEFQYYRSLTGHTTAAQGDQVFVYTISNNNTWGVTTRNTYTEIKPGEGLKSAFTNGTAAKLAFSVSEDIINTTASVAANSANWQSAYDQLGNVTALLDSL